MDYQLQRDFSSLQRLLEPTLGPNGIDVIANANGHVITTNFGVELLSTCPQSSHPAVRLLVDAARTLHNATGDGVKRFVMIITAALYEVYQHNVAPIQQFQHFNWLTRVAIEELLPRLPWRCGRENQVIKCVEHIMDTCLMPHYQPHIRNKLTELISEGLAKNIEVSALRTTMDSFESLVTLTAGGDVAASSVVPGILISSDHLIGALPQSDITLAVLIKCSLAFEVDGSLQLSKSSDLQHISDYWHRYIKDSLHHVHSRGVRLLIVTGSIPQLLIDHMKEFCLLTNICEETFEAIERISDVTPVAELDELHALSDSHLVTAHCKLMEFNRSFYINFNCVNKTVQNSRIVSFVLSAPTIGMAKQMKMAVKKCLRVLYNSLNEDGHVCFVQGGGAWEIELIRLLKQYREKTLVKDSPSWICVKAYETGLLQIVRTMALVKPNQRATFYQSIYDKKETLCVDIVEGHLIKATTDCGVIESYRNIQSIVCSSCQTLCQLCRIDTVHSILRKPYLEREESENEES